MPLQLLGMLAQLLPYYRRPDQRRAISLLFEPVLFPGLASLERARQLIQVYTIPSFEPMVSWSLYQLRDESYHVRRVRWDSAADQTGPTVEPTVYGADARTQAGPLSAALSELSRLQFPAFALPEEICIHDGVTFGIRFTKAFGHSTEINWHYLAPGCEALGEWYHRFVDHLEALLPARTDDMRLSAVRP